MMLGLVFGITESRAIFFGPMMSVYYLSIGLFSGCALFLLCHLICRKLAGNGAESGQDAIYDELWVVFSYVTGIVVVLTILKAVLTAVTIVPDFVMIRNLGHPFGTIFGFHLEVVLGLFLPFVLLLIPAVRDTNGGRMVITVIASIGAMGLHMQTLIPGQSSPVGPKAEQFPAILSYYPSIWEWLVALFAFGIMMLLYTMGEKYLKLDPVVEQ